MNREELLQAVYDAAAEYRRTTGDSTEDLSLALELAKLEKVNCRACPECTLEDGHSGSHDCQCDEYWGEK